VAQVVAELADNFAAFGRGKVAPGGEAPARARDGALVIVRAGQADARQRFAVNGGNAFEQRQGLGGKIASWLGDDPGPLRLVLERSDFVVLITAGQLVQLLFLG
jgi:hypothetical protein